MGASVGSCDTRFLGHVEFFDASNTVICLRNPLHGVTLVGWPATHGPSDRLHVLKLAGHSVLFCVCQWVRKCDQSMTWVGTLDRMKLAVRNVFRALC